MTDLRGGRIVGQKSFPRLSALSVVLPWLLGITLFWFHWLAIREFFKNRGVRASFFASPVSALTLTYALWYAFSIAANAPFGSVDRIIAAIYNLSLWFMGCFAFASAASADWRSFAEFADRQFILIAAVVGALSCIALGAWHFLGVDTLGGPSLLGMLVDRGRAPQLLQSGLSIDILLPDYVGGFTIPRLTALAPYPTATAALLIILLPFVLLARPRSTLFRLLKPLAIAGIALGLYLTLSRIVIFGIVLCSLFVFCAYYKRLPLLLLTALFAFVILIFTDSFQIIFDSRGGSTDLRFRLYDYQTRMALTYSPIYGMGLKDRVAEFIVPLGSHSTIIGSLYKTGAVGFMLVMGIIVSANLLWLKALHVARDTKEARFSAQVGFVVSAISVWMCTEDIDAPPLVCFAFFLLLGYSASLIRSVANSSTSERNHPQPRLSHNTALVH